MQKVLFLLLFILSFTICNAQDIIEKKVTSTVSKATVFLNSAQVTRTKNIAITKGVQILKFIDLSPFVDKKSIQVKINNVEIQSVNFQKNYQKFSTKSEQQKTFENQLEALILQIKKENINLNIVNEEISFLKSNKNIKGNQTLTGVVFRDVKQYYSSQIKTLYNKQFTLKAKIKTLEKEKTAIKKQINDMFVEKEFPTGEIFIKITSSSSIKVPVTLTYNVANVSWYPTYDIKSKDIDSPLTIVYKANVKQNSKVNWTNVKLSFSSANPSKSTKVGVLKPYFLDYGTRPPVYNNKTGEVTGTVYSREDNAPLPGANVLVKGTSIGSTTDFDGKFTIKVPDNATELVFSYLGYLPITRRITSNMGSIFLTEDNNTLEEIVVTGYATKKQKKGNLGKVLQDKTAAVAIRGINSINDPETDYAIPTAKTENQTSVSFEIVKPYTLPSSNKDYVIAMKTYTNTAEYTYYSIPKIEKNTFLIATLKDWEKMNLLEGEANIYFEDTFIGTSLIDTRSAEKVLEISLGIDKNVTISRKKLKDFTTKQFIGNKKEENRTYEIIVKNNKQQEINITILDQIPIAKREEITVTLDENSSGKLNKKTGEIKWNFTLKPKNSKTMNLKYRVRYPKGFKVFLD